MTCQERRSLNGLVLDAQARRLLAPSTAATAATYSKQDLSAAVDYRTKDNRWGKPGVTPPRVRIMDLQSHGTI
jgi:hypothetical protein